MAQQLRAATDRHEGLHLIALAHEDLDAQRDRLRQLGFALHQRVSLRKIKHTADGPRHEEWSVLRPEPGQMPEGRVQLDRGRVVLSTPSTAARVLPTATLPAAPFICAAAVRADLAAVGAALHLAGVVPLSHDEPALWVDSRDALGSALVFHDNQAVMPWADHA